tara:strand:+ start:914 stop:1237 length:324 start_codon:yes stop_codon:yes gene_type:complete
MGGSLIAKNIHQKIEDRVDHNLNISDKTETGLGFKGAHWVTTTTSTTGNFYAVQGIDAGTIDVSGSTFDSSMTGFTGTTDIVIPNGSIIYVQATTLATTGKVILYNK